MEQITQEQMNKIDEAIKALPDQLTKSGVLGSVIAVADSYSTNPISPIFNDISIIALISNETRPTVFISVSAIQPTQYRQYSKLSVS